MEPLGTSRWPLRRLLAALRVPAIAAGLLILPLYYIHVQTQHLGRVLYEKSRSGLRLTDITELISIEYNSPAVARRERGVPAKGPAIQQQGDAVHNSTGVIDTQIAGTKYKVFVQPVQLSLFRGKPDGNRNDTASQTETGDDYAEWLICG